MKDTIAVTGNIATTPEHRRTEGGLTITSFRLASSDRRFDRERSEWVDGPTNFYTVSAFRGLGENAFASLRIGERVIVTGKLKIREWENETRKGTAVEIDADALGHDLRWGTTTFHKHGEEGGAGDDAPPAAADAESGVAGEQWAVPGGDGEHRSPERSQPAEMVGAGTSAGETPF